MLRHVIHRNVIRHYHESIRQQKPRVPAVKIASSRVKTAYAARRTSEAPVRVDSHNPKQAFEPYPYQVTEENAVEILKKKVSPLHDVPYEEQLASKESFCRNALRNIGHELYTSGTPVRLDVRRLPCHIEKIVASPQQTRYRNRDEVSIWRGLDGKTITAGFMLFPIGKHGDTICMEPDGVETLKDEVVHAIKLTNEFLRNKAKLPVCFSLGVDGGWRRFMIRSNQENELMVAGILNPTTYRVREILEERDNFKEFMVSRCHEAGLKLQSLYYQPCPNNFCHHKNVPYELLHGEKFLVEKINGYKFQISPESYLYESSAGAGVLFDAVRSTIERCFGAGETAPKPFILNAKCGAGVMAINIANLADHVIGVDSSPQSIDDANNNAKLNDISNVQFVNAELEIVLERILEKYRRASDNMIVICDTPSTGLHRGILQVLRNNRNVNRLIMVVNKIESHKIADTIIGLCTNIKGKSLPPFAPVLATPVDTCPYTESFQTVLALERLPS